MSRSASLVAVFLSLTAASAPTAALSDADLRAEVEKRLAGDRTGACLAVALVAETTATAYLCADPNEARQIDARTAFEIGSVSKTMTAALVADLARRGEIALGDPLAKLLPAETRVPAFEGQPITLAHVLTHSSGLPPLPSRMSFDGSSDVFANPYARLGATDLLASLGDVTLAAPPGSSWAYSNFAFMVLSYGLARQSGKDFESLLRERLLTPLGMTDTYVVAPPAGVRVAAGHQSNRRPAGPWNFQVDLAGVGGVRSTLPDMVRFVEGQLGRRPSAITPILAETQNELPAAPGPRMGMSWLLAPLGDRMIHSHEGGTGGFSALVAFDRAAGRGVVVLSDTSLVSVGGLGLLGLHLLDPSVPAGEPRRAAMADGKLINSLVGRYQLEGGLGMELRRREDQLTIQADGQPEFEMAYDSAGDFFPLAFDALLRPVRQGDGGYAFTWFQMGSAVPAKRIDPAARPVPLVVPAAELAAYAGTYPLMPGFDLRIFAEGDELLGQGTGQGSFPLAAVDRDVFVAEAFGVEITFERDPAGVVVALVLRQAGQVLRGDKK